MVQSLPALTSGMPVEVGGLPGLILSREVMLYSILFHAAKGWIGDDKVHPVTGTIVLEWTAERIVVADIGGNINAV